MISSIQTYWSFQLLGLLVLTLTISCNNSPQNFSELESKKSFGQKATLDSIANRDSKNVITDPTFLVRSKALLTPRFTSLDEFRSLVRLEYFCDSTQSDTSGSVSSKVRLIYAHDGHELISELATGIDQGDIMDVEDADYLDQIQFVIKSPFAVRNRIELGKIYILARRSYHIFGEGDVAFYDLAEGSVKNINTPDLAYQTVRDSLEKGYLNTFNHVTAQAIITSFFSEELADFMADVHELHHMPELTTGKFTSEQLRDSINNPLDNYVDLINNEIGQEIGLQLREKYHISPESPTTPELLASYMNDLQSYYMWALKIGMHPFKPTDDLIVRFSNKMNSVFEGV